MKARKFLIAAAAAAVTISGALLFQPGQTVSVEAAQTGTVQSKQALEDNKYNSYSGDVFTGIFGKDNGNGGASEYKVVRADGSTTTVDNSNGQIKNLYTYSSFGTGFQLLRAYTADNKQTVLNLDGSYFAGLQGYHERVGLLDEAKDLSYYFVDGKEVHFFAQDGTETLTYTVTDESAKDAANVTVRGFGEYYTITYDVHEVGENYEYSGPKVLAIDKTGAVKLEGRGGSNGGCIWLYDENFTQVYYDSALNVSADWIYPPLYAPHNELAPNRRMLVGNEARPEAITAAGLEGWHVYTIDGKNYYEAYDKEYKISLVDENANVIIPQGTYVTGIGDHMFVVKNEAGYYNIVELQGTDAGNTGNTGSTDNTDSSNNSNNSNNSNSSNNAGSTSNPATVPNVKADENGNTKASLIPEGTTDMTFFMDAAKGVVPDGSIFKVAGVDETSKVYADAKTVLNGVVSDGAFRVYDINLLNSSNVKIQPNGKLSISVTLPNEFDQSKVAVYRINDDNTYTELKSKVVNGLVIFETDHFSTYVIAEKTAASAKSPETGNDWNPMGMFAVAAIVFAAAAVVMAEKW